MCKLIEDVTCKSLVDNYLENVIHGTVQASTYRSYQCVVVCLWRYLDPKTTLNDTTGQSLQIALSNMANDGLSKSTITKAAQVFRRAVKEFVPEQYSKFESCKIPRNAFEKKVDALSVSDQKLVEQACSTVKYGELFLFLLDTGLRGTELQRLKWIDYDGVGILIRRSKTENSTRYVPLTKRAKRIIDRQSRKGANIFVQNQKDIPISSTVLKRTYTRIKDLTGVTEFTTRICRHTFATRLVERGVNIKVVSKLMGHSSVSFTMQRYTTISKEMLFLGVSVLD